MSLRPHLRAKNLPKTNKAPWKALSGNALKDLEKKIKEKFNLNYTPKAFQLDAIKAQLQQKDVLVHAGTGSGKTMIVAGLHAMNEMEGKVTILVSPLIALQEEQVKTFEHEFGLKAIAINSGNGGLTKEKINDIQTGKYAVVIASPEMVLSKIFIAQLIRHQSMSARILSVVIDETHVVSHWGSGFRKKYATLGILKALLPRGTPFAALSATLPPRVRNDVIRKLQLNSREMVDLNIGNDRPNVSLVVRAMHHPMNSYRDLDFVIPRDLSSPQQIKKTFIYADSLAVATAIEDYLYQMCPDKYHYTGFIRPYSAAFSINYREGVMTLFRSGEVRVLICTDAAGMGCNIPDIDVVIQWKLPASVSAFVQRAGRAARGEGRTGLAILLVEKAVYEVDVIKYMNAKQNSPTTKTSRKATVRESSAYPNATKDYAKARGALRGGPSRENDTTHLPIDVPLDNLSLDEGLYTLAQTGTCRHKILTKVFNNNSPHPSAPCCDICVPELLDLTRPGCLKADKRDGVIKHGVPDSNVMRALHAWRVEIARRDYRNALFTGSGILGNDLLELLSSVGPIKSIERLKSVLGSQWSHWYPKYGNELLTRLQLLSIPPLQPKPRKNAGRRLVETTAGPVNEKENADSRQHPTVDSSSAIGSKRKRPEDIASNDSLEMVESSLDVATVTPGAANEQRAIARKKNKVSETNGTGTRERLSAATDVTAVSVSVNHPGPRENLNLPSISHQAMPATPARHTSTSTSGASTLPSNNPYTHLRSLRSSTYSWINFCVRGRVVRSPP